MLLTSTTIFNNNIVGNVANAQQEEKKQIFISNSDISKVTSEGDYKGEKHVTFYTPYKLVDNITSSYSYWSQNGDSNFSIELKNPISSPVCAIDIGVLEPELKTPFTIKVSNASAFKQANGQLDQPSKKASIDKCLTNVNKIEMSFKPTSQVVEDRWTILSEIKLFTDTSIVVPPPDPPICKPNEHLEGDVCVPNPPPVEPPSNNINGTITNSNVTLMVSNSTVTIIADETSSVVTPTAIPDDIVATSDPNDKSDEEEEEQEKEDQKEEEEKDEEDNDSKKDKNGDDN
jgi:hypothetical protein